MVFEKVNTTIFGKQLFLDTLKAGGNGIGKLIFTKDTIGSELPGFSRGHWGHRNPCALKGLFAEKPCSLPIPTTFQS